MRGGPRAQRNPSQQGNQLGQKGTFRRLEGSAGDGLWKTGQSKNCAHGLCHSPAHPSLCHESPGAEGDWVLESGVWSVDPGRGQLLAVKRQPEGTGVRSSTVRKVCRSSLGHHRGKASLLSGMQGAEPPLQPLSHPSASSTSTGTGRGSHWSGPTYPSGQGLLSPRGLQRSERYPSQSLLGNQPWVALPGMRVR